MTPASYLDDLPVRRRATSVARVNGAESLDRFDPGEPPPHEFPPVEVYESEAAATAARLPVASKLPPENSTTPVRPVLLRSLHEIVAEEQEPEWLIHKVLEASVLAVLAGPRSTFKSFIALEWAMRCAVAGHSVVILSGEGAGLDRRVAAWLLEHGREIDVKSLPIVALERPLSLNLADELCALTAAIADLAQKPALVLIDTLSKFSAGLDENSNFEVATFLSRLAVQLRDAFLCTVLLVAHSGHGDGKRPRGASALMANPDAEYIVERPNPTAMTVTVTRERFKDAPAMAALAYEARVVPLGRADRYGEPVTSLVLLSTDAAPTPTGAKGSGRNQQAGMSVLREWARANAEATHIAGDQITEMFKAQGINRARRHEVLNWLANVGVIVPSVGGFTVNREAL